MPLAGADGAPETAPVPVGITSVVGAVDSSVVVGAADSPVVDGAPDSPVVDGAADSPVVDGAADSPVEDGAVDSSVVDGAADSTVVDGAVVGSASVEAAGVEVGAAVSSLELEVCSVASPGCFASPTSSCSPLNGSVSSPHSSPTEDKEPP